MPARRSNVLLPAVAAAGAVALLCKQAVPSVFVTSQPAKVFRGRTAMGGFKEDFDAWRGSLTPEEKALVQKQAQGEFNKKFRKSDEFKKDLPEEKVVAFSKILTKFLDAEGAEEKKIGGEGNDPDGLLFKGDTAKLDFSLRPNIVTIDRDADRRYQWTQIRTNLAAQEGKDYPDPSPATEQITFFRTKEEEDAMRKDLEGALKEAKPDSDAQKLLTLVVEDMQNKAEIGYFAELPDALIGPIMLAKTQALDMEGASDEEKQKYVVENVRRCVKEYVDASKEIENDVKEMKMFFDSQKEDKKTKGDVLKEIHAMLEETAKKNGKKVAPLDEDLLADLEKVPAVVEGEFRHPWGIADKLYKSEAIDAFGYRYLLGIFETTEEAQKAFDKWNAEYMQSKKDMETELEQWSKQETAKQDADTYRQEAIKAVLESGRA